MTPQEKAKELVDHFMDLSDEQEYNTPRYMTKEMAVQCALIAVNEIIKSRKDDIAFNDTMWEKASEYYKPHPMYLNYWFKLRQEIESI
jgi:hypothetical protein